jgi:hypothetical protein
MASMPFLALRFCFAKTYAFITAGIHAGQCARFAGFGILFRVCWPPDGNKT